VTRQEEVSSLSEILQAKGVLPMEAMYLPHSWTVALGWPKCAVRDGKHISKAKFRNKVSGSGAKKIQPLRFSIAPGSLGSCGCSYMPISGAGCACCCVPKPELSHAANLPQPYVIQISYTWVFRLLCSWFMAFTCCFHYTLQPYSFFFFLF